MFINSLFTIRHVYLRRCFGRGLIICLKQEEVKVIKELQYLFI